MSFLSVLIHLPAFALGRFWFGYVIYLGFQRPALWRDVELDPRLFLPVFAIVVVTTALLLVLMARQSTDWRRMRLP